MSVKKRGLGRGLDALLGGARQAQATKEASAQTDDPSKKIEGKESEQTPTNQNLGPGSRIGETLRHLPVEFIQPGKYQPRMDMSAEALEDLAASIKSQGIMQPIVVRTISSSKYEIIAGERRWRACQMAGLDTIPVVIKEVPDEAAIALALIENIQRENLSPLEEATALKRLQDEFGLTQQEVADAVGKSRTTVTNLLRLMTLQPEVRTFLERGELEMGHARALLGLPVELQGEVARTVVGKELSVRQTEALVRRHQSLRQTGGSVGKTREVDPDIRSLQDDLADKLGAEVMIEHTAKGKGRLVIKYASIDQLDGILAHMK